MDELRTARTTFKRRPDRGHHERATINSILDEAIYCQIGFVVDDQPYVIPTAFGRDGSTVYIHGAAASRMLGSLADGVSICLTATILGGLVLARTAFHHSINYRSVMLLGVAHEVYGGEKLRGLRTITEHVVPGRWADVRKPTEGELKATSVLKLPVEEGSAKIRRGPPIDDATDLDMPTWAGEIPLSIVAGDAVPDPRLTTAADVPTYVRRYTRGR
jgi:nitroimidazol reductase NimA-like FMN-containing flavoprotein (pyridoxamine 5'-phosphate oxidase superfamily)